MTNIIKTIIINALALAFIFYILPIDLITETFNHQVISVILISVILAALNLTVKPIIKFFTMPITWLTLGSFTLLINAFIIYLLDMLSPQFSINSFWVYLLFGILFAIFTTVLEFLFVEKEDKE
jgi:putative membrane protein